ncbi:glyoxalase [Citricoccus nitrophenolicus]
MATLDRITIEADDPAAVAGFYAEALDLADRVQVRAGGAPTSGFRGFTLSLVVGSPATADGFMESALHAGAAELKPVKKSLWGYGGSVQAPDGTVVTVASSTKKDAGPATRQIDDLVLQLGVADVAVSKQFYLDHGLTISQSYGKRYVQFETGGITLALLKRPALAKTAGLGQEGSGSHRLVIEGGAGTFTDPDGFAWEDHRTGPASSR